MSQHGPEQEQLPNQAGFPSRAGSTLSTPRSLRPGTVPKLDLSPAIELHMASLEGDEEEEEPAHHRQEEDQKGASQRQAAAMASFDDLSGPDDSDAASDGAVSVAPSTTASLTSGVQSLQGMSGTLGDADHASTASSAHSDTPAAHVLDMHTASTEQQGLSTAAASEASPLVTNEYAETLSAETTRTSAAANQAEAGLPPDMESNSSQASVSATAHAQATVTAVDTGGSTHGTAVDAAGNTHGTAVDTAGSTPGTAVDTGGSTHGTAVDAAGSTHGTAVDTAGSTPGTAVDAAGSTPDTAVDAGSTRIPDSGLPDGAAQSASIAQMSHGLPAVASDRSSSAGSSSISEELEIKAAQLSQEASPRSSHLYTHQAIPQAAIDVASGPGNQAEAASEAHLEADDVQLNFHDASPAMSADMPLLQPHSVGMSSLPLLALNIGKKDSEDKEQRHLAPDLLAYAEAAMTEGDGHADRHALVSSQATRQADAAHTTLTTHAEAVPEAAGHDHRTDHIAAELFDDLLTDAVQSMTTIGETLHMPQPALYLMLSTKQIFCGAYAPLS